MSCLFVASLSFVSLTSFYTSLILVYVNGMWLCDDMLTVLSWCYLYLFIILSVIWLLFTVSKYVSRLVSHFLFVTACPSLWYFLSLSVSLVVTLLLLCLSVCLSVCPSVRPSLCYSVSAGGHSCTSAWSWHLVTTPPHACVLNVRKRGVALEHPLVWKSWGWAVQSFGSWTRWFWNVLNK